jgi:ABC-2 type transport system ATP-binding protein
MRREPIVKIRNLSKRFGKVRALRGIHLDIHPGRVIGLLGVNGAGKSTLLRHMIGLYLPDSGECTTFGCEAAKLGAGELSRIGYVHQDGELLDWMAVPQMIRYVAAYYPGWNKDLEERYVEEFQLPMQARVGNLSPGERQKLAVLLALGFEPELLILDEPAAAMDPIARRQFLDLMLEIIQDPNRTVLISSHILSDVEKIIDHVLIIHQGELLRDCAFDDLQEEFCRVHATPLDGVLPEPLPFPSIIEGKRSAGEALLTLHHVSRMECLSHAEEANFQVRFLPMSLEEQFRLIVEKGRTVGESG